MFATRVYTTLFVVVVFDIKKWFFFFSVRYLKSVLIFTFLLFQYLPLPPLFYKQDLSTNCHSFIIITKDENVVVLISPTWPLSGYELVSWFSFQPTRLV